MNPLWNLGGGLLAAGLGGDLFLRATLGFAQKARLPPALAGATFGAFATSSPELAVALRGAWAQSPSLSLGDTLGSNVVNIALILGLVLLSLRSTVSIKLNRWDFGVALAAPLFTLAAIWDGHLSRTDALLLGGFFILWLGVALRKNETPAPETAPPAKALPVVVQGVTGVLLLLIGGHGILSGAEPLARAWGVSDMAIGALLVSVGTSLPELATALAGLFRKHQDVSIGVVFGSNIFNGLFILPLIGGLSPTPVTKDILPLLGFGAGAVALLWTGSSQSLSRKRGILLLMYYGIFLMVFLSRPKGFLP